MHPPWGAFGHAFVCQKAPYLSMMDEIGSHTQHFETLPQMVSGGY